MDKITPPAMLRQEALEKEMMDRGAARYRGALQKAREKGREATTSYGQTLLARSLEPLRKQLDAFLAAAADGTPGKRHTAAKLLAGVDTITVSFLVMRELLDSLTRAAPLQSVAVRAAREVELEKKLRHLAEADSSRYAATQRHLQGHGSRAYRKTVLTYAFGKSGLVSWQPWTDAECLHLGLKLIELAIRATGYFRLAQKRHGKGMAHILEAAPECRDWIHRHQEARALLLPDFLPAVVPPKPWRGAWGGGYYSQACYSLSLVKTNNVGYLHALDDQIKAGQMPHVLRAVNALQDTAWAVNRRVLDVVAHLWDRTEGGVAGIPVRDGYPLPPCPICGADITETADARIRHACFDNAAPEVLKEWRRAAAVVRERNVAEFSKRLMTAKIHALARRYAEEPEFFFPYQLDFRGRIYAVPAYLTPQGPDLAKGLLHFAHGKPLGKMEAVRWLAIQGANTWGNDKVSLDARYSWVIEHQDNILATAADPIGCRWWHDADSPFCFLAFCFEWAGYVREGLSFASRLPIAMDGSCNGLQLFSLILRDETGGAAVNLLPAETPQDIYQLVADKVIAQLERERTGSEERLDQEVRAKKTGQALYKPRSAAGFFLALGINRNATKRQVMVLPYGGTRESCREYTEQWLKEKLFASPRPLPEGCTPFGLAVYLAGLIWQAIGETVVAARDAMAFLQGCATVMSRAGKPIRWTTPSNFPVLQHYRPMRGHRLKTQVGDQIIYFTLAEESADPNAVDPARQRSAMSPNFVHSLDASALMETVCRCQDHGIASFAMIHDSYGTHAADSAALARHLRETFVAMFGNDHSLNLLEVLRRELMAQLPLERHKDMPPVPAVGALEVAQVRHSAFFFA